MWKNFFTFLRKNVLFIVLLTGSIFLFFYHVDYPRLASWDEGWYASIAREMVKSGDYIHMNWNGFPFYDHPPMGMWLMALSFKVFGIDEFSARLPSIIAGILSTFFIFKIGETLFKNKWIGFIAGIILNTSVWYVIRVRSGNLDSLFMMFYLGTIYFSILSSKNFRWFPLSGLFFGALMMSKTLVGLSALPLIFFLNFFQILRIKNIPFLLGGIALFFFVVGPWYWINYHAYSDFYFHHFVQIGTRDKSFSSYFHLSFQEPLFYLHMGVRKWYYLWIASLVYLVLRLKFLKKEVFLLILWNLFLIYPFLTSEKTELWHLIPIYAPLALIISYAFYDLSQWVFHLFQNLDMTRKKYHRFINMKIVHLGYAICFIYIACVQVKIFYTEVFPTTRFTPDDVDISRRAGEYNKQIYLDDDYLPLAVFYSGKFIKQMAYEPDERKTLVKLFQSDTKNFVVITRNWALENLKKENIQYRVLEKNNSFTILTKK